jgi:hypothetical protein
LRILRKVPGMEVGSEAGPYNGGTDTRL